MHLSISREFLGSICKLGEHDRAALLVLLQNAAKMPHAWAYCATWFVWECEFWGVYFVVDACMCWSYLIHGLPRLSIAHQVQLEGYAVNPTVWMTWQDEDFIGKIARASRRQHARTCPIRTIQMSLITYRRHWKSSFGIS